MFSLGNHDVEERRRRSAAIIIQSAYRRRLAIIKCRDAYRSRYRKVFDSNQQRYLYQNKKSLNLQLGVPDFLGRVDLPSPRNHEAPLEYDPGEENTGVGYALIISNNLFPLGKWAPASIELDEDFEGIKTCLGHDYIGKIRPENLYTLKNPTTNEVQDIFQTLRRRCRANGFLFVYIATHVITVHSGNKKQSKENAYFAFRNSIWSNKNADIVESCISLTDLSNMMNKVYCREKSIIVNYAHSTPPRHALFSSSKHVYPPPDFLHRLANACQCAVIGSCAIGYRLKDYAKYHPNIEFQADKVKPLNGLASQLAQQHNNSNNNSSKIVPTISPNIDFEGDKALLTQPTNKASKSLFTSLKWSQLLSSYDIKPHNPIVNSPKPADPHPTWRSDTATGFSIQITLPTEQEVNRHNLNIAIWYTRRILAKPVNLTRRVIRYYRDNTRRAPDQMSLVDHLNINNHTIFGGAMIETLKSGLACDENSSFVSVKSLFRVLYRFVQRAVDKLNVSRPNSLDAHHDDDGGNDDEESFTRKGQKKDGEKEGESKTDDKKSKSPKGKDTTKEKEKNKTTKDEKKKKKKKKSKKSKKNAVPTRTMQTPALVLPYPINFNEDEELLEEDEFLSASICFRCGPPAAPERPYVLQTKFDSITLEWYNQLFDGVQPTKYRIFMQNQSRNFHHWREVYYPGEITKHRFIVRNLPLGVPTQFRIQAGNNGGWSAFSDATALIVPGEEKAVVPTDLRWRRLTQSGVLGILDRMQLWPEHRLEQLQGLKKLLAFGLTNHGFKSHKMALSVAEKCLALLQSFAGDDEVVYYTLQTLFWTMKSQAASEGKNERKVRFYLQQEKNHFEEIIQKCAAKWRHDGRITLALSALKGLSSSWTKMIGPQIEYRIAILFPSEEKKSHDELEMVSDDSSDDEEGDDGAGAGEEQKDDASFTRIKT